MLTITSNTKYKSYDEVKSFNAQLKEMFTALYNKNVMQHQTEASVGQTWASVSKIEFPVISWLNWFSFGIE